MHALDGLRGVAALLVLVHHTLLLHPDLVAPYRDPHPDTIGGPAWLLTYTPIHLLWDGSVAVVLFFVLSGFVLCLPAASGRRTSWRAYYPQRLVRLYLPVLASVLLAVAVIAAVPGTESDGRSDWLTGHRQPGVGDMVRDGVLIVVPPGVTNSALWSLRWEVIFSLLLPAFIVFGARGARLVGVKVLAIVVLLLIGAGVGPVASPYRMGAMFHLPVFAVGCLMAFHWTALGRAADRIGRTRRHRLLWCLLTTVALLGMVSYWLVYSTGSRASWLDEAAALSRVVQVGGAALLLFVAGHWRGLTRPLGSAQAQWLGTRSFSLYLVHEPLVVAVGHTVGTVDPLTALAITVPLSLLVAEWFFRAIERPSHNVSRRLATRLGGRRGPLTPGHDDERPTAATTGPARMRPPSRRESTGPAPRASVLPHLPWSYRRPTTPRPKG